MLRQDKLHELITAAVQRITIPGAEVTHNEKVGKRQFDVMVRIPVGMHPILMAYEVKDKNRPTPVETVDAFVTKARHVGANKAIIVSTSGFQSGALEAAKQHGVDLFNLSLVADELPSLKSQGAYALMGAPESVKTFKPTARVIKSKRHTNAVREAVILYSDGSRLKIPGESSQMQHCLGTSIVHRLSLEENIRIKLKDLVPKGKKERCTLNLVGLMDTFDEIFIRRGRINGLELLVEGVEADAVESNYRVELTSVDKKVIYENAFTMEKFEITLSSLPFGFQEFKAGEYYFAINPLRYHFCESIYGDIATLVLVESFQMGKLIQGEFTQKLEYSQFYFPANDKDLIDRLGRRLQKWRAEKEVTAG